MVSVGLYSRTIIPTIRSVADQGYSNQSNSTTAHVASGGSYTHITVPVGETVFASWGVNSNTHGNYHYNSMRSSEDLGTDLTQLSKYNAGNSTSYVEYKNNTASPTTLQGWFYVGATSIQGKGKWNRILIMNDSDLAKWERVNLPTTRYRKYAVDKYYMLAKWNTGSFNIDGYTVSTTTGGIVEVPVETIISSTALTGSGAHFFQVTGQGFTVTA